MQDNITILVTGGAGYIGSHFVKYLKNRNYSVVVLDNLSRGNKASIPQNIAFENVDLLNKEKLLKSLNKYDIDVVVHFAAFAYVGESVENPSLYYKNNVIGSYNLIDVVNNLGIKNFIFSSTCSIYGNPNKIPISEESKTNPLNPYAKTKLTVENILKDYHNAYNLNYVILRYFNAAGCDFEGEIGESHNPEPHLIPIMLDAAIGKRNSIDIYGDDYPTKDGTCVRDYIHVNDLADAHIKAVEYLENKNESTIINLGTGEGNSVKEIIKTVETITQKKINAKIVERRAGDPAILVADNKKAKYLLDWSPRYQINEIIESAWQWHKNKKY